MHSLIAGAAGVHCWTGEGGAPEGHGSDGDHETLVQQSTRTTDTGRKAAGKEGIHDSLYYSQL